MAGVNTCVRGLIQNSGFDAMAIIAAALNAAGHEVQLPTKTTAAPKDRKATKARQASWKESRTQGHGSAGRRGTSGMGNGWRLQEYQRQGFARGPRKW